MRVLVPLVILVILVLVTAWLIRRPTVAAVRRRDLRSAQRKALAYERFVDDLREEVWQFRDVSPLGDILLGRIRDFTQQTNEIDGEPSKREIT